MDIMREGRNVIVIEPEALIKEVKNKLKEALEQYNGSGKS
jgi:predicted DNA-binding transcriptional regulator YafY